MKDWKEQQAGHYIPRANTTLRYSEINTHCQCVGCNVFKRGNIDEYALRLVKDYGKEILEELKREKDKIHHFTIGELEKMIAHYLKELQKYD
ncbi:unnamed protein product [marine sediment metagenome]|uniref:Uncharacterized protein n=1 Tax=marine sediment metagenome TaxID=412755 RepID=X1MPH0_9ZZZZ